MANRRRAALIGEAMFGGFDGLMTAIGVVMGLQHAAHTILLRTALTVSVASAFSMAGGALFEEGRDGEPVNGFGEAVAMGGATLLGTFVPAVPMLLLPLAWGLAVTGVLSLGVAGMIGVTRNSLRARGERHWRADLAVSYAALIVVAIPTIVVALAFGPVG